MGDMGDMGYGQRSFSGVGSRLPVDRQLKAYDMPENGLLEGVCNYVGVGQESAA